MVIMVLVQKKKKDLSSIHDLFVSCGNYHILQYFFNSNRKKPQSDYRKKCALTDKEWKDTLPEKQN